MRQQGNGLLLLHYIIVGVEKNVVHLDDECVGSLVRRRQRVRQQLRVGGVSERLRRGSERRQEQGELKKKQKGVQTQWWVWDHLLIFFNLIPCSE